MELPQGPANRGSAAAPAASPAVSPPPATALDSDHGAAVVVRPRFPSAPTNSPAASTPAAAASSPAAAASQLWVPATMASPAPTSPPASLARAPARRRRWLPGRDEPAAAPDRSPDPSTLERPLSSYDPVALTEAIGFAVRFAADYLSWDEDEPARRAEALRTYLPDGCGQLGWSGVGRQRADLVTAGRSVTLPSGVVVVEVTARVVSYRRVATPDDLLPVRSAGEMPPALAIAASSAPPAIAPGWEAGSSWWTRIAPPVRRHHDGQLVIDLGLDPATAT
jgi:hypothetical protein